MALTNIHWGRVGVVGFWVGAVVLFIIGLLVGGEVEYLMDKGAMEELQAKVRSEEAQVLRDEETEWILNEKLSAKIKELQGQVDIDTELRHDYEAEKDKEAETSVMLRMAETEYLDMQARLQGQGEQLDGAEQEASEVLVDMINNVTGHSGA